MDVVHRLKERGNTVIIIEHNLDVICEADYIIDMGPEGGRRGGEILSTGSPSEIAKSVKGYTPKYVKAELESR
jgi:excinuclease ABC subunit A